MSHSLPYENVLGYPVTTLASANCVEQVVHWLNSDQRRKFFACANPHALETAADNPTVKQALLEADLLTPDGVGVLIASRLRGGSIQRRVTGSSIFYGLMEALNREGRHSCFFLGSSDEHLAEIQTKVGLDYPNVRVAGVYSPPFKPRFTPGDNKRMIEAVNQAKPDVLWVGMTAPKQELWIHANLDQLDIGFAGAVGAVFDFYTGRVQRSHPLFRRVGLEWLPRLLRQPGRLWRRTLVSAPRFLWHVLKYKES